jgi:glycosyltransferase involved in cell wall biosynthesis
MKVAYLTNQYPKVSHTFIRREIAALEERGVEILRFSIRPTPDRLVDPLDIEEQQRTTVLLGHGATVLLLGALKTSLAHPVRFFSALVAAVRLGARSERGMLNNLGYLLVACALLDVVRREGCDHVHVHFGTNPTAVAMLCHMLGGPRYSFTVHGPEEFDKPWSISLEEKIARADFVVAISSFGRSQLYRHCAHQHWKKIVVVRCGVDRSYLEATPTPVPDTPQLVCVGRLCEQKGQLLLVEAVSRLHQIGEHVELVLVGDGEMRGEVDAAIADHGLGSIVEVTGWAPGDVVRDHLLKSRALVLPSFAEGLPVVIMEALALGRPALTTYIAGIPELVEPGVSGWLVPAGSVDALVSKMVEILHAPADEISRMGLEGRARVLSQHDARTAVVPLLERLRAHT